MAPQQDVGAVDDSALNAALNTPVAELESAAAQQRIAELAQREVRLRTEVALTSPASPAIPPLASAWCDVMAPPGEVEPRSGDVHFRTLAERAQHLIYRFRLAPQRGFEYVSQCATSITGYAPEDYYATPRLALAMVHPDDRHLLEEHLRALSERAEPIALRWRRKDGAVIWVELVTKRVRDAAGHVVAIEGVARDITAHRAAEDEARTSAEQLKIMTRRLVEAHEQESRALARELHDEVGQVLTSLKLSLAAAAGEAPPAIAGRLADAQATISELMARIRGLSLDFRPPLLDDLGLLPAVSGYLDRYTQRTQVRVELRHQGIRRRFPPEVESAAYRTIQEALTNVARHAEVHHATVRLLADNATLMLRIDDAGRGFQVAAIEGQHTTGGLSGMRERLQLIGGSLTIESAPGAGTHVIAELPLLGEESMD